MRKFFFISFIILWNSAFSCSDKEKPVLLTKLKADRTIADNRSFFKTDLIKNKIEKTVQILPDQSTEKRWLGSFWAMSLLRYRSAATDQAIRMALDKFESYSLSFQRALLEVIITLYPNEFVPQIQHVLLKVKNPKLYAMCIHYLTKNLQDSSESFLSHMTENFSDWRQNPILQMLHLGLKRNKMNDIPSLRELLSHPFPDNAVVLFSLQRADRRFPGIVIIRNRDGTFLRHQSGELFYIQQLTLSSSNMPGYLTNGNSPQGIYSMQGSDKSENVFIGPTPNLQLVIPFEVPPSHYFHSREYKILEWDIEIYERLLPEGWKNYMPFYETYFAGQAGRSEIIAHGTTINPDYYLSEVFYPLTPSQGCLTALERWDPNTGRCLRSDQVSLINALIDIQGLFGYLVVVEINDEKRQVEIEDVNQLIFQN